jgi:hypothetical protein
LAFLFHLINPRSLTLASKNQPFLNLKLALAVNAKPGFLKPGDKIPLLLSFSLSVDLNLPE